MYTPSEETILANWETFLNTIDSKIAGKRKDRLMDLYTKIADRVATAPYSSRTSDTNCFVGGYIQHVNLLTECAQKLHTVWREMSDVETYTEQELYFVALNHELGLIGTMEEDYFIPNPSEWHVKNRGEVYTFNDKIPYSTIPDRTLFLLQKNGISVTFNEMLGIKLHDGLYEKANEKYLLGYIAETRPRTSLVYIIHHASVMAKQIEFQRDYSKIFEGAQKIVKNETVYTTPTLPPSTPEITPQIENKIENHVSESILSTFNEFFK